eukprot:TRINITY_DN8965_c0_g2_i10.p1 TRINITY_DN8965_c0_g2~~TRINITY_DN8965_c0_g2_i10.p1  ORF type:complete len:165 (-),score=12.11 TRINITY_DN8965_c0_g2_i10:638-1132(-)
MLLGCNSSFIVMAIAREFPSFKGNCIYFASSYDFSHVHQIYDSGVFNCEDWTIEPPLVDWCHHPTTLWPPLWIAIPPYSLYSDFREKTCDWNNRRLLQIQYPIARDNVWLPEDLNDSIWTLSSRLAINSLAQVHKELFPDSVISGVHHYETRRKESMMVKRARH